ncbi:MAG: NAD(P)-binding domain-containing protein [Bacteroidales bacterium]|nr:NAD(P)-binding domain-containing protein [Bacteroidales bacterium]
MKITIIGAGNMGGAAALGLAKKGAAEITVTARHEQTLKKFEGTGVKCLTDNKAAVKDAQIVIIAVKPWIVPDVIAEIKPVLDYKTQQIVSFAPGVKAEDLLAQLKDGKEGEPRLSYVIPNTAIEVGESMTFVSPVTAEEKDAEILNDIFSTVGVSMIVPQKLMIAGTGLASCGIAYALRYIRAAAEGGVETGFYAKDATAIVAQTVKGAAALLLEHKSHPEAEIDKVTTPGGMTIKGLNAMEAAGFTDAVIKGVKAGK